MTNKKSLRILMIFNLMILSACATGYHKMGFSGGYSDMRLGQNIYRVVFRGNGFTNEEKVTESFYRRCAELTKEHGYEYFIVTSSQASAEQVALSKAKTVHHGTFTNTYNGVAYDGTTTTEEPMVVSKHKREGIVVFFTSGKQPQGAMSAVSILSNFDKD